MTWHFRKTSFFRPRPIVPAAPSMLAVRIGFCLTAIWAIFTLIAIETRTHAWIEATRFGGDVATLIQSAIARELSSYDLSIQALAVDSTDTAILGLPAPLKDKALFDDSAKAPDLGRLLVLDREGRVIDSSLDKTPVGQNFSDRDYFQKQRERPDLGLYVSAPFKSRISHQASIALSRRRPAVSGAFNGVAMGVIKLSLFTRLFGMIHLPPDSAIALMRDDGIFLSRRPTVDWDMQKMLPPDEILASFAGRENGTYTRASVVDGTERLFSFRRVPGLPLYVTVGLSTSEIFGNWRWEMLVIGTGFAILSGMIVLLGVNLGSEFRRRGEAELRLATLASTDHLTLLANRRRFDEMLEAEWRRGARTLAPLSLLMVDCDYFKSFNDTFGHVEGDRALRAIAEALRRCVDRSGDLVARYGGEEFAVLLPDTEFDGAHTVAVAIREAIDALGLGHAKSSTGRLTVSIGIACRIADGSRLARSLVEAADAALYRAKGEGRDCIVRDGYEPSPDRRVA